MRKLLLASAASLAGVVASATGAMAQPVKPVAPGTLVVHLNGYLQFEIGGFGSTYNTVQNPAGTGSNQLNSITTNGDVRIYPGFDAETTNGIAYGVQVETRVTTSNAGKAVGSNSTSAGGTSSIYIRRAYGYIGAPSAGFVRFGQGDGAFTLLQSGAIQAFGDGGQWNDDGGPVQFLPTAAVPSQFIYADQGALYATDKVVYLTPAIAGISGAISYEPNSNGIREGYAGCVIAGSTCAALSSSTATGDIGARRKNTVDGMLQYSLKANGFVVKASAGYLYGAGINYDGAPTALGTATHFGYDNLGVYQAGAQVTFAGLTLGGNIKGGEVEDSYGFKPRGARNAFSYIIGGDYVIGPVVVGASYFNSQTSGSFIPGAVAPVTGGQTVARTLSEYGLAVGGNYVLSKNLSLFVQYLYGHRHQPGNPFGGTTVVAGRTVANGGIGNAQVQLIAGGATFKW